jgi:hypothetical protein
MMIAQGQAGCRGLRFVIGSWLVLVAGLLATSAGV